MRQVAAAAFSPYSHIHTYLLTDPWLCGGGDGGSQWPGARPSILTLSPLSPSLAAQWPTAQL